MDAPEEEDDIRVQRDSGELLADFEQSLKPFLYNGITENPTTNSLYRIRRRVRISELERLVSLLENFQELPQLLDPYLPRVVPPLAQAFLESISRTPSKRRATHAELLTTVSQAICRLLYTFCKIRGEKIIVRFLSTEPKHVDPLFYAIEEGTSEKVDRNGDLVGEVWSWEERYVTLLWLSQSLLAPFDLASMSTNSDRIIAKVPGLSIRDDFPSVASNAITLGTRYISSSGKERDAARILLVRVALRHDMQKLDVLEALIHWALSTLKGFDISVRIYDYIGVLSFLAGITKSSLSTSYIDKHLPSIFEMIRLIMDNEVESFAGMRTSAVVRELCIKILRNVTLLVLRNLSGEEADEMVNVSCSCVFDSLADGSTPVRLAASKALSAITLKLDSGMAGGMVDEILDSLNKNVRTIKNKQNISEQTLDSVNPQEWHGLILTLSQLLYRRSPPSESLHRILEALMSGLTFNQRSTLGGSIGTNVRDAACFGLWSLARKYSTAELQGIEYRPDSGKLTNTSTLQAMAVELAVAASLDPAGNIRRGSSAALQELIGRHPNTITKGIDPEGNDLISIVDYHAVALRSRAIKEVACETALLSSDYAIALSEALSKWRGICDPNAATRRHSAEALGSIYMILAPGTTVEVWRNLTSRTQDIYNQISGLRRTQTDERHGLILSLAAIVGKIPGMCGADDECHQFSELLPEAEKILSIINLILEEFLSGDSIRNESEVEATANLTLHAFRICCFCIFQHWLARFPLSNKIPGFLNLGSTAELLQTASKEEFLGDYGSELTACTMIVEGANTWPARPFLDNATRFLEISLRKNDLANIDLLRNCTRMVMLFANLDEQERMIKTWIRTIQPAKELTTVRRGHGVGIIAALWTVFTRAKNLRDKIEYAIIDRWSQTSSKFSSSVYDLETRVAILRYLADSDVLEDYFIMFSGNIQDGLSDYHIDSVQGDIGSQVRIVASTAAARLWEHHSLSEFSTNEFENRKKLSLDLFGMVLRLCTEKLDNVRTEARKAILSALIPSPKVISFKNCTVTSYEYFAFMLNLQPDDTIFGWKTYFNKFMMEGYVTSAASGTEDIIRNSRAALVDHCEASVKNIESVTTSLYQILESAVEWKKKNSKPNSQDRSLEGRMTVPTLEVIAFLFDMNIMQKSKTVNFNQLYRLIQEAHIKSKNVKLIEASVKCYGGLSEVWKKPPERLFKMLQHAYPNIRKCAADELHDILAWKNINWTQINREDVDKLVAEWKETRKEDLAVDRKIVGMQAK